MENLSKATGVKSFLCRPTEKTLHVKFYSYDHNSFYDNFILSLCFVVIIKQIWIIFDQFLQFNWQTYYEGWKNSFANVATFFRIRKRDLF